MKTRLLIVGHSPNLHGAEYSCLRLLSRISDEVDLRVAAPGGGPFEEGIRELGIPFESFTPMVPFVFENDLNYRQPQFAKTLKKNLDLLDARVPEVDVIHTNTHFVWEGATLAARRGLGHLWNLREIPRQSPLWRPMWGWENTESWMHTLTDHFACNSSALIQTLSPDNQAISTVVYNGLDIKPWSRAKSREWMESTWNIPPESKIFLTVGNFIPEKGHLELLVELEEQLQGHEDWFWVCVGAGGPSEAAFRQRIIERGLEQQVICPGPMAGMGERMAGADVYLLPSLTEAFPTVLLEAGRCRVPFLATDRGGSPEVARCGGGRCYSNHRDLAQAIALHQAGALQMPPLDPGAFTQAANAEAYLKVLNKIQSPNKELMGLRQGVVEEIFEKGRSLEGIANRRERWLRLARLPLLGRFIQRGLSPGRLI